MILYSLISRRDQSNFDQVIETGFIHHARRRHATLPLRNTNKPYDILLDIVTMTKFTILTFDRVRMDIGSILQIFEEMNSVAAHTECQRNKMSHPHDKRSHLGQKSRSNGQISIDRNSKLPHKVSDWQ